MKKLFSAILLITILVSCGQTSAQRKKTILIILAHPDDETTIGALMAKYAKQNKVYYIVATDGRYGTRVNNISEDTLVQIRKSECENSCKHLGIEPPIFLGFLDGLGMKTGIGEYFKQTKALTEKLKTKIEELNPDFIITFGPDGDTGHPDHRIIGNITTEIVLREGWLERFPIFYLGWTKQQAAKFGIEELNYVDPKYFNVSIRFDDEHENKAFESIRCFKSQNTQQEIDEWIDAEKKDTTNIFYFRKLTVAENMNSDFIK